MGPMPIGTAEPRPSDRLSATPARRFAAVGIGGNFRGAPFCFSRSSDPSDGGAERFIFERGGRPAVAKPGAHATPPDCLPDWQQVGQQSQGVDFEIRLDEPPQEFGAVGVRGHQSLAGTAERYILQHLSRRSNGTWTVVGQLLRNLGRGHLLLFQVGDFQCAGRRP